MSRGATTAPALDVAAGVAELFIPRTPAAGPGRVGLELELIAVAPRTGGPPRRVTRDALQALVDEDPLVRRLGNVTFEPGGQLELSPACAASAAAAVDTATALVRRLRQRAEARGIVLLSCGADPWSAPDEVGLQADKARYRAMQAHFDAIGPAGRRMMRCTAALQVCIDLGAGTAAAERWRLLNLAGPPLLAALANSPVEDGVPAGAVSSRSLAWQATDPSRTGFEGSHVDAEARGYTALARAAEAIPLPRGAAAALAGVIDLPPPGTPFGAWLDAGGERPDGADLAHHLSTLFPPVRPRSYLEVRYLDALPLDLVPAAVCLLVALAEDARARRAALEVLGCDRRRAAERWDAAARLGPRDPAHRAAATELLRLAGAAARRAPAGRLCDRVEGTLEALAEQTAAGRCPADDRLEAFGGDPLEPAPWT